MSLPRIPLPTETVITNGVAFDVRGLSRSEARKLTTDFKDGTETGDVDGAEVWMLSTVLGVSPEEAAAWRDVTPTDAVDDVLAAILRLSGLAKTGDGDPKDATNGSSSTETLTLTTTSSPSG